MGAEFTSSPATFTLLVAMILCCFCTSASLDIRLPPSIIDPPIESKIFRTEDEITLNCVASGIPKPEYEWLKDGAPLTIPGQFENIFPISDGTIKLKPLMYLSEGIYQCVASNQYGKTMSPPTVLQRAVIAPYPPNTEPLETAPARIGAPLTIHCQPTKCFPKPSYTWMLSNTTVSQVQTPVIFDRRVQMDEQGNLNFAYLVSDDAQSGRLYKCNLFNPHADLTVGGSYTRVNLLPGTGEIQRFGPTLLFSSPSPSVALEGQDFSLRCFFSGYPAPTVYWTDEKGTRLRGRFLTPNYHTELIIPNVVKSDEGMYVCQAGLEKHSIRLNVHAVPVFRSVDDQPHNVNVTTGDNVTVVCNAYSNPPATVMWFINGEKLDRENLPQRLRIAPDNTRLTISNVCRDCAGGTTDIQVIQCNASNAHGTVFGSGYINVLKKTEMDVMPVDVRVVAADSSASFNCSGVSDDSTPVSVKWFRFRDEEIGYLPVVEIPGQVVIEETGSLSFRLPDNRSRWTDHAGQYNCSLSNGYSMQSKGALLQFENFEQPLVETSHASFPWWILILIIILILLLLCCFCCCWYLRSNRGETYPVDEKERKNGHNPEKELADSGFQDYIRPEQSLAGSRASLGSTRKTVSDDEASLNEYGDIDAGKFTEDGSFIGDYGDRAYV